MINEQVRKFLAFEWIMIWVFGFFWAGAMFLPLFLTGSLENPAGFLKNFLIMCGPYLGYVVARSIFLIWKGLVWSYLTSNFFFKNEVERIFSDELFRFLVFGLVWALIIAVPMYFACYFDGETSGLVIGVLFCGPYAGYLVIRGLGILLGSLGWAVKVTITK